MLKISKRASVLTSSPIYSFFRLMKEKEAQGQKIISLGLGEPYQDTPEEIKKAGIEAILKNITHYNPAAGSMQLRKMIAEKYGAQVSNVSVSSGAKPFLATVFMSLLDEGDLVFLATPFYPPFLEIIKSCGGNPILINTKKDGFALTLENLKSSAEKYLGKDKKLNLIINSPNNPTGVVSDKDELEKIVAWCLENNINVISDECYNNFSPDPEFSLRSFSDQVIVINSFSKTYAMTGWRVGYVVCPEQLNIVIGRYLDSYLGCACSISDEAAITAMNCKPLLDFKEQREIIHSWLEKNKIEHTKSNGGIFIFPDFSSVMERKGIKNSMDLATYFLEKAGVATTPGISFGDDFDSHLRISYCVQEEKLTEALKKMEEVIK